MKNYRLLLTLAVCCLLTACEKWPAINHSLGLTWTKCASTKAADTKGTTEKTPTMLILEHTDFGLAVTLTDAEMNCAIDIDGLVEHLNIEGNVITYVLEQSNRANCICRISQITSTIPGLIEGNEYILKYYYGPAVKPIKFRYQVGFKKRIDVDKNLEDPISGNYGEE